MSVSPIPLGMPIVDKEGKINEFFRLRWQDVQQAADVVPARAAVSLSGQAAAIAATSLYTALSGGLYRVTLYLRRTAIDGAASSLQATLAWEETGQALTKVLPLMSSDTLTEVQDSVSGLRVDEASDITLSVAYTSTTPGAMTFEVFSAVEQLQ